MHLRQVLFDDVGCRSSHSQVLWKNYLPENVKQIVGKQASAKFFLNKVKRERCATLLKKDQIGAPGQTFLRAPTNNSL